MTLYNVWLNRRHNSVILLPAKPYDSESEELHKWVQHHGFEVWNQLSANGPLEARVLFAKWILDQYELDESEGQEDEPDE